jgi:hypothetical protein
LSGGRLIQSTTSHPTSSKFILVLFSHLYLVPSVGLPTTILHELFFSCIRTKCSTERFLLDFLYNITWQELEVMKFVSAKFYPTSFFLVPNMLLSTVFLNTSVYVLPSVGDNQLMAKHTRTLGQDSRGRLLTKWNDGHLFGLWYQFNHSLERKQQGINGLEKWSASFLDKWSRPINTSRFRYWYLNAL